jgi:hypothetical protein
MLFAPISSLFILRDQFRVTDRAFGFWNTMPFAPILPMILFIFSAASAHNHEREDSEGE